MNEDCAYYALEGLDYLLMAGKYGNLTEHHLEEALQSVVDGKLFCIPQGETDALRFLSEGDKKRFKPGDPFAG